jgi:pimeloyl-ACP methyl ester carboxylesterase
MDVAASYQFVVDALSDAFMQGRQVIAPDWRGYGLTTGPATDNYWFPDYFADLDFLIDHSRRRATDRSGRATAWAAMSSCTTAASGRNASAGWSTSRVSAARLPPRHRPRAVCQMDGPTQGLRTRRDWTCVPMTVRRVARRLAKTNPRLARDQAGLDKAEWLATHWARENPQGQWEILGDPAHKIIYANLSRVDEMLALYRRLTMPVLAVEASEDPMASWWKGKFTKAEYHERLKLLADYRIAIVQDAGHMLHHDQPDALARLLEEFLG